MPRDRTEKRERTHISEIPDTANVKSSDENCILEFREVLSTDRQEPFTVLVRGQSMSVAAAVGTTTGVSSRPQGGRPVAPPRRRAQGTSASRHAAVRRLLSAYHRHGDLGARARLVQQYLPLVRRLARQHAGHGEQFEDLVQVGAIG